MNDVNNYGKTKKLKYAIQFINCSFMAILKNTMYENVYPKSLNNQPNIEVIGNIHENPELL